MAQLDQELRIADVYATALFELARGQDQVDTVRAELDELVRLLESEPEFARFLTTRAFEAQARAVALERMFRGKLSDLLVNTLLVMNRHGRCGLLPALRARFIRRQEQAANEIQVTVTSAVELAKPHKNEIVRIAAEVSGKRPLVKYVIDPEILGGLIVQIGALRMDNSVRWHLRAAREQLLERARRGLTAAAPEP